MKYNIDKFLQSTCQKHCYLIRSYDQENYIGKPIQSNFCKNIFLH